MAVGVAGLFMETHEDPDNAPSDGPNMVPLNEMEHVLTVLKSFDQVLKPNTEFKSNILLTIYI